MFNQNDIFAALQSGAATAEEIAQKFTEALNAAIAQNEKALADQKKKEEKSAAMQKMLVAMADLFEEFYPDIYEPELRKVKPEEIVTAFDAAYEDVQKLNNIFPNIEIFQNPPKDKKKEDPIAAFLKSYNL